MARKVAAKSPKKAKAVAKKTPKKISKKTKPVKKTATKPSKQQTIRYCFMLRHGLRGDHVGKSVDRTMNKNPDPILTELGHKQCVESGKFLKKQLAEIEKKEGRKFDRVIVRCSPYIRTLASAGRVCKELGLKKAEYSYLICELLNANVYASNPLPKLEYKHSSAAKLDKTFNLQGIKFSEFKEAKAYPKYPETFQDTHFRALDIIDYQESCVKKEADGKMTAYIGISHGWAIYQIAHILARDGKIHTSWDHCNSCFTNKAWIKKNCNYCSITSWRLA